MIIACPECSSEFNVPAALIGAEGRKVRCAKCKHEWHQNNPDIEDAAQDEASEPVESPYKPLKEGVTATASEIDFDIEQSPKTDEPSFVAPKSKPTKPKPTKIKKKSFLTSRVFVMTSLLLLISLGGLYMMKDSIWAQKGFMARVYSGLGLVSSVTNEGAGIDRITLSLTQNNDDYGLEISTSIINLSEKNVTLGALKAEVIGPDGKALPQSWKFAPPKKTIEKGARVPFKATLENVKFPDPEATYSVKLSFI